MYDASKGNFCMFVLQIKHQIHFESKHQSCHCQCMNNAYPHKHNIKRDSPLKVFVPFFTHQTTTYILNGIYEGGSICNENPFITPSTNALGLYAICQTKDQSVAVIMVHETLFYLSKFNKLQTF